MGSAISNIVLVDALFTIPGLAGVVNECFDVWKTVSTTVAPSETTSAGGGQILQEDNALIFTSVAALNPTLQSPASTSTEDIVKADTGYLSSLPTTLAATVSPSSASQTSSGYNGACSERAPCVGDITYYDTATTASNPSSCGTTNNGLTELVLALPHGIMTDSDCGRSVTISYNGITKIGTVVDKCMGCDNNSIDLSQALFEALAGSVFAGRISGVKWYID
jgi:hypothetical protein